jgi:hypothetical protein
MVEGAFCFYFSTTKSLALFLGLVIVQIEFYTSYVLSWHWGISMSVKLVCRGCGKQFGEAPNAPNIKGVAVLDVCPRCGVDEAKRSERIFQGKVLPMKDFNGGPWNAYNIAIESFKAQIDALPRLNHPPRRKFRVRNRKK